MSYVSQSLVTHVTTHTDFMSLSKQENVGYVVVVTVTHIRDIQMKFALARYALVLSFISKCNLNVAYFVIQPVSLKLNIKVQFTISYIWVILKLLLSSPAPTKCTAASFKATADFCVKRYEINDGFAFKKALNIHPRAIPSKRINVYEYVIVFDIDAFGGIKKLRNKHNCSDRDGFLLAPSALPLRSRLYLNSTLNGECKVHNCCYTDKQLRGNTCSRRGMHAARRNKPNAEGITNFWTRLFLTGIQTTSLVLTFYWFLFRSELVWISHPTTFLKRFDWYVYCCTGASAVKN